MYIHCTFCPDLLATERRLPQATQIIKNLHPDMNQVRIDPRIWKQKIEGQWLWGGINLEDPSDQRRGQETPWVCPLALSWCHSGDVSLKVTGGGMGMHPHGEINSWPQEGESKVGGWRVFGGPNDSRRAMFIGPSCSFSPRLNFSASQTTCIWNIPPFYSKYLAVDFQPITNVSSQSLIQRA